MEMKKCKECGKLFVPKSARQQYCDAKHYRPCPICGELVYAKYLSDPARRCDKCKGKKASSAVVAKPVDDTVIVPSVTTSDLEGVPLNKPVQVVYDGPSTAKWTNGHKYIIRVAKTQYGYTVHCIEDITAEEVSDIQLPLTSMISVNQYFKLVNKYTAIV